MNKAILLAALITSKAFAADPATFVTETTAYDTEQNAVKAALSIANEKAIGVEFGGAIIKRNGSFFYTDAVTTNDMSKVSFRVLKTHDSEIVAIYHIHPKTTVNNSDSKADDNASRFFSNEDVQVATKMNVHSYIFVQIDNSTHEFVPGVSHTTIVKNEATNSLDKLSAGEII